MIVIFARVSLVKFYIFAGERCSPLHIIYNNKSNLRIKYNNIKLQNQKTGDVLTIHNYISESIFIATSLSLDALAAGFAYGANKININFLAIQIINLICAATLAISYIIGISLKNFINPQISTAICFIILFFLGFVKLLDGFIKALIKKNSKISREINFSLNLLHFNFNFILKLYAVPEDSDSDCSKNISPVEAASIALALSLDGAGVGFGAALGNISPLIILFSLVTNTIAIISGKFLGRILNNKFKIDLSWLAGIILIILAITKLI